MSELELRLSSLREEIASAESASGSARSDAMRAAESPPERSSWSTYARTRANDGGHT